MTGQYVRLSEATDVGRARILKQLAISARPCWTILNLGIGPENDGVLPDEDACGSSQLLHLSDEILFGASSLILRAVRVKVPEVNASAALALDWLQVPKTIGLPQLPGKVWFDVPIATARAYVPECDTLAILNRLTPPTRDAWQLEINCDLALLVEGEDYVGWALSRTTAHMETPVSSGTPRLPLAQSEAARSFLGEFLRCVDDSLVLAMENRDECARLELVRLRNAARSEWSDGVHELLAEWLDDIESTFYG
jgi:hypothetical protein